jgi:hypothetical protein
MGFALMIEFIELVLQYITAGADYILNALHT